MYVELNLIFMIGYLEWLKGRWCCINDLHKCNMLANHGLSYPPPCFISFLVKEKRSIFCRKEVNCTEERTFNTFPKMQLATKVQILAETICVHYAPITMGKT